MQEAPMPVRPATVHSVTEYTTISADGTVIAAERSGDGPPLVLVDGAMCHRASHGGRPLAALLADRFTVHVYDRRGRGGSGGAGAPWSVERELEDLAAVIAAAGGSAVVFGTSSGAVLALRAAAAGLPVERVVAYEPPFAVEADAQAEQRAALAAIERALAGGAPGRAVRLFMELVGLPRVLVALLGVLPGAAAHRAVAPTLPHDLRIIGAGGDGPLELDWAAVGVPALLLAGGKSPEAALVAPARKAAAAVPGAEFRVLDGQTHRVSPAALVPVLAAFATGAALPA
jgi:pimeloyl-ACP methyl ester carboxylesterase